jgi:hypothetical protein
LSAIHSAAVLAAIGEWKRPRYGGGSIGTLRAYQAFHPDAAIYDVTYRGRTVWMTSKQRAIWHEVQKYWHRGKRDTLARIATIVGCSRATVSRFLRRLDLWRFIDLATIRGRNGGTYIFTRVDPYNEKPRRWTYGKRERIRAALTHRIRRGMREGLSAMMARYALPPRPQRPPWWETATQEDFRLGSTDATFTRLRGISGGVIEAISTIQRNRPH